MFDKIKKIFTKETITGTEKGSGTTPMNEEKIPVTDGNSNSTKPSGTTADVAEHSLEEIKIPETEVQEAETLIETAVIETETRSAHSPEEIKEEVIKVLKTCYDPEIPVDVWELGLIYEINVATNGDVLVVMTLTSPSCPVAGVLPNEIEQKIKEHPMVNDCKVQLTFDPPWSQLNMSEVAKLELGFL